LIPLIEAINLKKEYLVPDPSKKFPRNLFSRKVKKEALKDISFKIAKGELVGYIGLNGAGKSTTIKILTGIIAPSSGKVLVNGQDPFKNRLSNGKVISVMFGQRSQLIWDLPVYRSFDLLIALYRVNKKEQAVYLEQLYELLNVKELLNTPVRLLSLGQRMRCEFCSILLHKPELLYLDEPTIGMDVLLKSDFKQLLNKINQDLSTTILLTSHDLDEIEELCQRIIIIDKGTILFDGDMEHLKKQYQIKKKVIITFYKPILPTLPGFEKLQKIDEKKYVYFSSGYSGDIIDMIGEINSKCPIANVEIIDEGLEDIIKKIYQ
jgi:ABC-2 type transport system ATP-binding protein